MTEAGVSVIIPCYNGEVFLADAIRSVAAQTMPAQEVLVVDDGSRDKSAAVAESFGPPVRVIRQPNAGVAAARNRGIAEATGDWIAFLDADDLWVPEKLAMQLAKADAGYDLVYSDAANFGDCEGMPRSRGEYCEFPEGDVFVPLAKENFVTTSSVILRRSLFDRVGRFRPEFTPAEDWGLWFEVASVGRLGCVNEALVKYRVHGGGLSRNADKMVKGCLAVLEWAHGLPAAKAVPPAVWRRSRAGVHGVAGLLHERAGARRAATKHYAIALRYAPGNLAHWKNLVRACLGMR